MKDLRGLKIHCDNEEEKKELLKEATKQEFVWCCGGEKPLEWSDALRISSYRFSNIKEIVNRENDKLGCISYKEYKAMSGFTKADLKPCMVVVFRNGDKAMVGMDKNGMCLDFQNRVQCLHVKDINDDLSFPNSSGYDIVKVFGYSEYAHYSTDKNSERDLIWEDNSVKISVSDAEEELSKLSGKKYKIIKE